MAFNTMILEKNSDYESRLDYDVYRYTESVAATVTSDPVIIPTHVRKIIANLVISSGVGKIQTSISSIAAIKAGSANWIDWDSGDVSVTTQDVAERVNGVRVVNTSGTVVLELLAF